MNKLLYIDIAKVNFQSELNIDSHSSVALIDISLKDICIKLRSLSSLFDVSPTSSGHCQITVFDHQDYESDIRSLNKTQLEELFKFYSENVLLQKQFLKRTPIYRHLEKVQQELTEVYENIVKSESVEIALNRLGDRLEFYNNQLSTSMRPSRLVEITQCGFSHNEVKSLMSKLFEKLYAKYSFLYKVDFNTLTFE